MLPLTESDAAVLWLPKNGSKGRIMYMAAMWSKHVAAMLSVMMAAKLASWCSVRSRVFVPAS